MVKWIRNFKWPWVRNREIIGCMQHRINNIEKKLIKARVAAFIVAKQYRWDDKIQYQIPEPISLEDLLSRIEGLEERRHKKSILNWY